MAKNNDELLHHSAGIMSAATHFYLLAYLVLLRRCTDGRAGCAHLAKPDDSDLLVSPSAVRFNRHGDAQQFLASPLCPLLSLTETPPCFSLNVCQRLQQLHPVPLNYVSLSTIMTP